MKYIVTGGAGFIGSHVVDLLLSRHHRVLVIDNFSTGKLENLPSSKKNLTIHEWDIKDLSGLLPLFYDYKPDYIIHLAAQAAITTAAQNPSLDLSVNGIGTINVIQAAKTCKASKIIHASTSAVYDPSNSKFTETSPLLPDTCYGISKLAAELYMSQIDSVRLRFGNVYGPRQVPIGDNQVIARAIRHLYKGEQFFIFGNGEQKRDFVYVEDVAHAIISAASAPAGVYNIASGHSFSVNQICRVIAEECAIPDYPWDHTGENDKRKVVQMDIKAAYEKMSWYPRIQIREGVKKTLKWWKK